MKLRPLARPHSRTVLVATLIAAAAVACSDSPVDPLAASSVEVVGALRGE
jgi:hypothetical protein